MGQAMKNPEEERMTDTIGSLFTGVEAQKRQEIVELMSEWLSGIERKYEAEPDDELWAEGKPRDYFVSDGFFPGYYHQNPKVLFIEREITFIPAEHDWVAARINDSKNGKINNKGFNSRLSYLVQGIKTGGKLEFEHLEFANDYAKEMAETNDYGFAYMNISKYANEVKTAADWNFINQFLEDSNWENRNFFHKELEILEPDVIITGNLWETPIDRKYLDLCFGKIEWKNFGGKVNVSNISINGKSVKLLDTWHLSAPGKSDKEDYYDPVMKILFGEK
jgi:hypothetical protein